MAEFAELLRRVVALPDGEAISETDAEVLKAEIDRHPYFVAAAVALLRHASGSAGEELDNLRHIVALEASDRRTLLAAKYGPAWTQFYPEVAQEEFHETVDVIDVFLRTYGNCTPEEEAQLERMIFNPTPDYAELLARQEQQELPEEDSSADPGSQDALINAFIRSQHPKASYAEALPEQPETEETPTAINRPEHTDDSLLSESLAKIFIKQGRYERAYEIISGLNLKFPKKSAYFADQLRFLNKLIINQRRQAELDSSSDGVRN